MTTAQLIGLAIQLSMAMIIFCVALDAKFGDVVFVWRRPGLLSRSLFAMLVVMPLFAIGMAMGFDLQHTVEIALLASALSPVPPILPSKQIKAGGESSYVVGLLTTTALVVDRLRAAGRPPAGRVRSDRCRSTSRSPTW